MIYDIFYVSKGTAYSRGWENFRGKYPSAQKIDNVKTFEDIRSKAFTKFFYVVWDDTHVTNFDFDYRVSKWDEEYIHVWKTLKNGDPTYQGGVALFSKKTKVLDKEFNHRFYLNKKEMDYVASAYRYPIYTFKNYKEYVETLERSTSPLVWSVPDDLTVTDETVFDLYFDHLDGRYDYDRSINHVFKNANCYDGICLFSKDKIISEQEFKYRYPIEKKEWDRVVSQPKPFDIIFISYNEAFADENFERLKNRFPRAKRIHGVKGIHQAHIEAAKISGTELFWVVDADAEVLEDFNFEIDYVPHYDAGNRIEQKGTVQVWYSKNPINDLIYGYGGVKLLPKHLTLKVDIESADMTTSISKKFKVNSRVSNITKFNTDPFSTWRSAFRECAKLAGRAINEHYDNETDERLEVWTTVGEEKPFGKYAIAGAKAGKDFGEKYGGIDEIFCKINNFDWLENQFKKWQEKNE